MERFRSYRQLLYPTLRQKKAIGWGTRIIRDQDNWQSSHSLLRTSGRSSINVPMMKHHAAAFFFIVFGLSERADCGQIRSGASATIASRNQLEDRLSQAGDFDCDGKKGHSQASAATVTSLGCCVRFGRSFRRKGSSIPRYTAREMAIAMNTPSRICQMK